MGAYTNFWTEAETGGRLEGEGARVWCTESGGRQLPLPAKKFPLFPAPPAHIHSSPVGGKAAETKLRRGGVVCAHKHSAVVYPNCGSGTQGRRQKHSKHRQRALCRRGDAIARKLKANRHGQTDGKTLPAPTRISSSTLC